MSANAELKRVKEWPRMRGFANLFQKENRAWWSTKRWWINGVLWTGLVGGMLFAFLFIVPALMVGLGETTFVADNGGLEKMGLHIYYTIATLAITIGVIILSQDLVLGEKQIGLTEYLLANPVQRKAYILAKLCASLIAVLILLIALPGAATYAMISLGVGEAAPLAPYLAGLGLFTLHSFYYLTLTIMLGVFFNSRSPILGIPIGIYFIGLFFSGLIKPLMFINPSLLTGLAEAVASGVPIPSALLWPPVLTTGLWCVVFILMALIKFERTEF